MGLKHGADEKIYNATESVNEILQEFNFEYENLSNEVYKWIHDYTEDKLIKMIIEVSQTRNILKNIYKKLYAVKIREN